MIQFILLLLLADDNSKSLAQEDGEINVRLIHRVRAGLMLITYFLLSAIEAYFFLMVPPLNAVINYIIDYGNIYAFTWKIYFIILFQIIAFTIIFIPIPLYLSYTLRKIKKIIVHFGIVIFLLIIYAFLLITGKASIQGLGF